MLCSMLCSLGVCTKFGINMVLSREQGPPDYLRRGELAQVGNGAGQNSHADIFTFLGHVKYSYPFGESDCLLSSFVCDSITLPSQNLHKILPGCSLNLPQLAP